MDIAAWLASLGLERYNQVFHENEIDVGVLPRLTADDLKDIGVVIVGHRRKLLEAIADLQTPQGNASVPHAPPLAGAARRPDAERRHLTVMFIDLVGSTALSAQLDPEDMRDIIRLYQNTVAGEITRFEGHIAKFMGDGVLAYFGWPRAHEDEAERAVRAGLAVSQAVVAGCRSQADILLRRGSASQRALWSSAISSARGRRRSRRLSATRQILRRAFRARPSRAWWSSPRRPGAWSAICSCCASSARRASRA